MAGAANFEDEGDIDHKKWDEEIFGKIVSGRITNNYSEKDYVLHFYKTT
jgi:hypothetical protein